MTSQCLIKCDIIILEQKRRCKMIDYQKIIIDTRKEKGISQIKLAKMIGVTQAFMSEIESGRKTPSLQVFFKICEVLEIELFPNNE